MATRPEDLIYAVDECPPWPKLVLLGLQQAILASVYLVLLVIVARAAGVSSETALAIVSLGMVALAISTVLQAKGKTRAVVSYDELQLLVDIDYEGSLLTLPNVGLRRRIFLEEESFSYGLADFLTGVYPDRMESSARGTQVTIRLYFTA